MLYLIPCIARKRLQRAFLTDVERIAKGESMDYYDWILNQYFASRARVSYQQSYDFLEKMCQQWGGQNIGCPKMAMGYCLSHYQHHQSLLLIIFLE